VQKHIIIFQHHNC